MSVLDRLKTVVERLHSSASVESVYGDPIEANGRTIIPVSKVAYGFGAGYGSSPDDETPAEQHAQESEGGGLRGGVAAQPAGVVEITESRTTFVRPTFTLRQITLLVVCLLIGYMLGVGNKPIEGSLAHIPHPLISIGSFSPLAVVQID